MKRQPRILAGTAIGLLMASAPLGALPLSGKHLDTLPRTPLILAQEECQGENCPPKQQQEEQQAPAEEQQQAPAEEPAPEPEAQPEPAPEPEAQPEPQPEAQPEPQPEAQPEQQAPAEEAPAEQPPAAEQPAPEPEQAPQAEPEKAPAEQAPSQEAPAEEAPDEQPQTQEAPAEQAPAQKEAPAQEQPAEEAPAEQPQTEQAPTEQAPAEQPPAQEAPAGEQPPAEQPQTEQPSTEQPAEGQTAPEAPATGEQPAQQGEQPATGEQPAQEGAAPADPNAAPILDSQKEAAPAQPGAESGQQQPAQTGEQPVQPGEQPAQPGEQAAQPQAPVDQGPPPESDADAQATITPEQIQPLTAEQGQRIEVGTSREERQRFRQERRERRQDAEVVQEFNDNRTIITINNQTFIDSDDDVRIVRDDDDVIYEELPRGRIREVVTRPNGVRIITIRNRYGDIIRRSRIEPDNREVILVYVEDRYYQDEGEWRDPGLDLPPMRLTIPREEYILDAEYVDEPDAYYEFLEQPPVERVERTYSLTEVKRSARIRDKVRRIDMDTLTFEFGSASIPESEIPKLEGVADAMKRLLEKNPAETFLLEGHTDAVGSENANLALSDKRAEAVAEALTNVFEIPPENLATQGYGEQYLKVNTQEREKENRRVAIRRVTPLVAPVASAN
jgi:outer membrane protein OmpA-like peptidoglycan-associated protein